MGLLKVIEVIEVKMELALSVSDFVSSVHAPASLCSEPVGSLFSEDYFTQEQIISTDESLNSLQF